MLNEKTFKENLNLLSENFNFQVTEVYMRLIFNGLKEKISDQRMKEVTEGIVESINLREWNSAYGYGGKPALADWIDVFVPKLIEKRIYKPHPITGANMLEIIYVMPDDKSNKKLN